MQDSDNIFVFFKPSTGLTNEIIKQNQALVKEYTVRTAPEEPAETNDYELDLGRFDIGHPRPMRHTLTSPVEAGQNLIAERIYNYLSSLSESPWAMDGGTFPVSEYLPNGMMTMLGFSSLRKQSDSPQGKHVWRLVEQLTEEFVDWLANEQNGAFVTPWLEIHLATRDEFRLIAIPENEVQDATEQIVEEATEFVAKRPPRVFRVRERSKESSMSAVHKQELDAFVRGFEAGKRAYQDASMSNDLELEETPLMTEEDYGESEPLQGRTFATASARAEDNSG